MIFPEPKIILRERSRLGNDWHSGRRYTLENINSFSISQIMADHIPEFIINGKKVKSSKPASRYCFKYKYLFYKIECDDVDALYQNKKELENYQKIQKEDKIYFSTVFDFGKSEAEVLGRKIQFSYSVHKFESSLKKADYYDYKSYELIKDLSKKYDINDIGSEWNWGYKKYANKLVPFIYDLGV